MNIEKELFKLQDKKYQEFQQKLSPETNNIIGIRIPILRKFAKDNKEKINLNEIHCNYYEEIMLKGMLLGMQENLDLTEIKKFIPLIDNWSVCDTFCAGLKQVKNNKEEFLKFIKPYLKSKNEFEVRFAVIILLDYYIDEEHINIVLILCENVENEGYYVKMAVAWAISICLIKYYDVTKQYLKNSKLDDFTYNKSLQKALESYRISESKKIELRNMKRIKEK